MTVSQAGIDFIKGEEGLVLPPYLDTAGVPTIGYGNTRYLDGRRVTMQDAPITQEEAELLLKKTVNATAIEVDAIITDAVNQNNFDALVSLAYNIGTPSLKTSTVRRLVNANPNDPAILGAFQMWDKIHVDGSLKVSFTLVGRRNREAALYFS